MSDLITGDPDLILAGSRAVTDVNQDRVEIINSSPDVLLMGINRDDSKEMSLFNLLREDHPQLPVLVLTKHTPEGAKIALKSLKRGAVEYFPKTTTLSGSVQPDRFFKERLLPVIKAVPRLNRNILISGYGIEQMVRPKTAEPREVAPGEHSRHLLVIAGCLGGIPSLYILLSTLPDNLQVPVVVVQHMPEIYSKELADDLNRVLPYEIQEATEGSELKPGRVLISPGNVHSTLRKNRSGHMITLNHHEKVKGFRPSIDLFLSSAATSFGDRILTVYLSGGGKDGIEGAKVIDIVGGQIILQSRDSSLLPDLPSEIQLFGIHEGAYPLERLGQEITRRLF
ncbi:MAG: chemotaxis protein CheB [Bacteroidota bacterium]